MPNITRVRPLEPEDERWLAAELVAATTPLSQELAFAFILASELAADFGDFVDLFLDMFRMMLGVTIPDTAFPSEAWREGARTANRPALSTEYIDGWEPFNFIEGANKTVITVMIFIITYFGGSMLLRFVRSTELHKSLDEIAVIGSNLHRTKVNMQSNTQQPAWAENDVLLSSLREDLVRFDANMDDEFTTEILRQLVVALDTNSTADARALLTYIENKYSTTD